MDGKKRTARNPRKEQTGIETETDRLLKKTLPAWFESTFPVRVRPGEKIRAGRISE